MHLFVFNFTTKCSKIIFIIFFLLIFSKDLTLDLIWFWGFPMFQWLTEWSILMCMGKGYRRWHSQKELLFIRYSNDKQHYLRWNNNNEDVFFHLFLCFFFFTTKHFIWIEDLFQIAILRLVQCNFEIIFLIHKWRRWPIKFKNNNLNFVCLSLFNIFLFIIVYLS